MAAGTEEWGTGLDPKMKREIKCPGCPEQITSKARKTSSSDLGEQTKTNTQNKNPKAHKRKAQKQQQPKQKKKRGKKGKEQGRNKNRREFFIPISSSKNIAAGRHFAPDEPNAHLPHYPSHR